MVAVVSGGLSNLRVERGQLPFDVVLVGSPEFLQFLQFWVIQQIQCGQVDDGGAQLDLSLGLRRP